MQLVCSSPASSALLPSLVAGPLVMFASGSSTSFVLQRPLLGSSGNMTAVHLTLHDCPQPSSPSSPTYSCTPNTGFTPSPPTPASPPSSLDPGPQSYFGLPLMPYYLSQLEAALEAAVCTGLSGTGCITGLSWSIELAPQVQFPSYLQPQMRVYTQCIAASPAATPASTVTWLPTSPLSMTASYSASGGSCQYGSISAYLLTGAPDLRYYR